MARIRYKTVIHGVEKYAPFTGALIVAPHWQRAFTDDTIEAYKEMPCLYKGHSVILNEVLSHPENKGLIFGGLDWSMNITGLVTLIDAGVKRGLKILINVPVSIEELEYGIGRYAITKTKLDNVIEDAGGLQNIDLVRMIGSAYLDLITADKDFYIIAGLDNPKMYVIKKENIDEYPEPTDEAEGIERLYN